MQSFRDIIDGFGYAKLACTLGKSSGTVSSWRSRNLIPSPFWSAVNAAAAAHGVEGISLDLMASLDAKRAEGRARKPSGAQATS